MLVIAFGRLPLSHVGQLSGMTKMRKAGFSLQAGMSLQQAPIKCKLKG